MRLEEYTETEIGRLTTRIRGHLQEGDEAAALVNLQKMLTLLERVLDGSPCPPVAAPASVGDKRWDALVFGALTAIIHQPQWPKRSPLPEPWFPMGELTAHHQAVRSETPPELAGLGIFIHAKDLRWHAPPASSGQRH